MDREGFRNRLKQYKKAREENPGLKYWEWKAIPKYDEGTGNVREWDPKITAEGYDDKGYYVLAMNPMPEVVVYGPYNKHSEIQRGYTTVKDFPEATYNWSKTTSGNGALELIHPEFEILTGAKLWSNSLTNQLKFDNAPLSRSRKVNRNRIAAKRHLGTYNQSTDEISGSTVGELLTDEGTELFVFNSLRSSDEVFKMPNAYGRKSVEDLFKKSLEYLKFNRVPNFSRVKLEGHVDNGRGTLYPIFSQKRLNTLGEDIYSISGNQRWNNEIIPSLDKAMSKYGYKNMDGKYIKGDKIIGDIHPGNIGYTTNGDIKLIDAHIDNFAEGGEVEPDPLEVLERSKPKFHGIPLAKGNIDGVFSPIDVPLATLPKVWPVVNKWLPNYGQMLGALVGGDDGLTVNRKAKPITTKLIDADVKEHYEDIVIPLRPLEDYIKQIYLQNPDNFAYNVYADNALPDNRLADFNNATGEVRIKESILNSPIASQILAHEINGHRSDRSLPRSKEAKATIDKAFNVRKKPLSKESKLLAEKEAETTRLSYNFYKYMKDNGLLLIKKPMAKTKAYQDYVLNATDDQIDVMLGNSTVYSRDYKASGIDYDKIRWALAYAPEIAAGLIVPQHLLNGNKEEKQWT